VQESHVSRLEKRKKEAAATEAMAAEMKEATARQQAAVEAAAAAAEADRLARQRSAVATPGREPVNRRMTTPRRPTFL
jgi:hypothetical protein